MYRLNGMFGFRNMHKIWEDQSTGKALYLGDYYAASNVDKLKETHIKAVLTAAAGLGIDHTGNNITHKVYNAWDMPSYNISRHFEDAYEFIDSQLQNGNVLVHCAAGISRSSTIVIMYLMKKMGWDLRKALSYVKSKRSIIAPNYGFIRHLENYEKVLNLAKTKTSDTKISDSKLSRSKVELSVAESTFSRTKESFTKTVQKRIQENLRDSKIKMSSMVKSYYKAQSQDQQKPKPVRPLSIQKISSNPPSKRSSMPAWKRFLHSTQPLAPRIVTIKP